MSALLALSFMAHVVATAFAGDTMSPVTAVAPPSFHPGWLTAGGVAEPGRGIRLIAPPSPSSTGDAALRYPLDVPPGRAGMEPQLELVYGSGQGNGWLGVGWDLALPAITVDSRWGVPRYSASTETETYLMDGQQLTPGAHRGAQRARAADAVFRMRVEGAFARIARHGDRPSNYWWEVIDQHGMRYVYGDAPGKLQEHTLRDAAGNIFGWALRTVEDMSGNRMSYGYARVTDPGVAGSTLPGVQLYPKSIRYTEHGTTAGAYEVRFVRDRDLPGFVRRHDVIIDARGGFKQVTADLLRRVDVSFGSQRVRSYELGYQTGAFGKTLLTSLTQRGEDGSVFHTHSFDYYQDTPGFEPSVDWSTGDDDVARPVFKLSIPELGLHSQATALSGSISTTVGGHLYVGFNASSPSKSNSVGGKLGFTHSNNETVLELVDLDGDGLPDKVFKAGGKLWVRRNRSGPRDATDFGPPLALPTLSAIAAEESNTISGGPEAYPGPVNLMLNHAETFSTGSVYLSDVNGDKLPDLVSGGQVLFNHLDASGVPTFTANSKDTPVPIGGGTVDSSGVVGDFEESYQKQIDASPLHDTLRRWVAPHDGTLAVSGSVQLVQSSVDGVRVAIQHNGSELWAASLKDTSARTPSGVDAIRVRAGDRLYFRVQSVLDGAGDEVAWDPQIRYAGAGTGGDANGLDPYAYRASSDFVLVGHRGIGAAMPLNGVVRVSGNLHKLGVTTDDVTVVVRKNDQPLIERSLAWDKQGDIAIAQDITVARGDILQFHVGLDSPVDFRKIEWVPAVVYRSTTDRDPGGNAIPVRDAQGNELYDLKAPYSADLYSIKSARTPPPAWVAPDTGRLTVAPQIVAGPGKSGTVTFTVKRPGALLGKQVLTIANGQVSDNALTIDVTKGDALYFDYATVDPSLAALLSQPAARVTHAGSQPVEVAGAVHTEAKPELFGPAYRGWSHAGYNGNRNLATLPIDESRLVFPSSESQTKCDPAKVTRPEDISSDCSPESAKAYMFSPDPAKGAFAGPNERTWISSTRMSSSRLGAASLGVPRPAQFAGARAVSRIARTTMTSLSGGIGPVSGSYGKGKSYSELDYLDMNGDGFPDVVGNGRVQYTTAQGGLEAKSRPIAGLDQVRESSEEAFSGGLGGNPVSARGNAKGGVNGGSKGGPTGNKSGPAMVQLGLSGSLGGGTSSGQFDLMDMNGDGLPDRVTRTGNKLDVALNLGYGFAPSESWGEAVVSDGAARELSVGLSPSYNTGRYDFAGGLSAARNESQPGCTLVNPLDGACVSPGYVLMDLNGDGLPDRLTVRSGALRVAVNHGTGFEAETVWTGLMQNKIALSGDTSVGGGLYFTVGIGPLCVGGCYIIINPGVDGGQSMARQELSLVDMDGDGDLDHVASTADHRLTVARNRGGRGNLLRSVSRPMGGTIALEYDRDGNTTAQPESRWVLSKVTTFDGQSGDGVDTQVTTYRYEGGFYDRLEREFYGYRRVVEEERDATRNGTLYRVSVTHYRNDDFYTRGLLQREEVKDAAGQVFEDIEHTYALHDVDTGSALADPRSTTATVFPQLTLVSRRFHEGTATPGLSTSTAFEYDRRGRVIRTVDAGDAGTDDDRSTTATYTECSATHLFAVPVKTVVTDGRGTVLAHSEATVRCTDGVMLETREYLDDTTAAVTSYSHDTYGNVTQSKEPANAAGQRYTVSYEHDATVHTYVTKTTDSLGHTAVANYDLEHGVVESITDINGQRTSYAYDEFGRVVSVSGPYEQGSSTPALRFEYHPEAAVPWALTRARHGLGGAGATIDTVVFGDGHGRIIQSKRHAAVHTDPRTPAASMMVISGRVKVDHLGRAVEVFAPTTEPLGSASRFNPAYDTREPQRFTYDVLDRVTSITQPDRARTTFAFAHAADRDGKIRQETTVTDANGNPRKIYRNMRDLITGAKEFNRDGQEVIWTSYAYDALDRITQVRDQRQNLLAVAYDRLGRRTTLDSPDTGRTTYGYDLASNLVAETDATMAAGQRITYHYHFGLLTEIRYPDEPANNVQYSYGAPGAPGNQAGRVSRVRDRSGTRDFFYGKLGETIKTARTMAQAQGAKAAPVYTTEYAHDSFGRLATLTYPDGEVVTYGYDSGGQVNEVEGVKAGNRYRYLERLEYDRYGQRVFMEAGNKIATQYAYDPDSRRLASLRAGAFQNLSYRYDPVGNLLGIENDVPLPKASEFGGPSEQTFQYDDLYRLTGATGSFGMATNKTRRYGLSLAYDVLHNLVSKQQTDDIVQSQKALPQRDTTYALAYAYAGSQPRAATRIGDRAYRYDATGNLVGWSDDRNGTRSTVVWDDAGRMASLSLNGHELAYTYDHAGERASKRGPQGETVYVNPYFTIRNGQDGEKHVFVGGTRLASKQMGQPGPGETTRGHAPVEKEVYYYHPDHLGSTAYVTDARGQVYQHIEYFPSGETWVEEATNIQRTPYRFIDKELDEESGLYYFGARYYDPRTSAWQSADPATMEYLDGAGLGGVYNSLNLAAYAYAGHNPLKYVDLDGRTAGHVRRLADDQREDQKRGTVAVLDVDVEDKGRNRVWSYEGASGGRQARWHPDLEAVMDDIPRPQQGEYGHEFYGKCAEVVAINKALKDGVTVKELDGASIRTAQVRLKGARDAQYHGETHAPCPTCKKVLAKLGVKYQSDNRPAPPAPQANRGSGIKRRRGDSGSRSPSPSPPKRARK
jgi:RHS repeat-associated protein